MKFLFLFHSVVGALLSTVILAAFGQQAAIAFLFGVFLGGGNFFILHFCWSRILKKKLIALSIGIIVIKYATLGFIIYQTAVENWFHMGWLSAGFGTVVPTALATAFRLMNNDMKNEMKYGESDEIAASSRLPNGA